MCNDVKDAACDINEILNVAVGVAGVNALAEFSNLKDVGERLNTETAELDADIVACVEFSQTQTTEACTALETDIETLSAKFYLERMTNLRKKAYYKLCNYIEAACPTDKTWTDIKTDINNILCKKPDCEKNESDDTGTTPDIQETGKEDM